MYFFFCRHGQENQPYGIENILKSYWDSMIHVSLYESCQKIIVRRRHVWDDTKRGLQRHTFDPSKSVLLGKRHKMWGPLREYFTLLWRALAVNNSIFTGPEGSRSLTHNMLSLKRNDYAVVGNSVSLALMYGGSGPHFFSQSLTSYIFEEPISEMMIADVPDYDVQESIQKV